MRAIERPLKLSKAEISKASDKLESVGMDGEEGTATRDVYVVEPTGIVSSLDVRDMEDESQMTLWNHHQDRNIGMEDDKFSFRQVEFEVPVDTKVDMSRKN